MDKVLIRTPAYEDLIDRIGRFESFSIYDRVYSADLLIPQLVVKPSDLPSEAMACAAFVLYWGLEAARARRLQARVEAAYRAWRDRRWLEIKTTEVSQTSAGNPKLISDGHADKSLRADPDYGIWRGKLDDAQAGAEMAEAIYEAFKLKSTMIKSAAQVMHDEAGGPYTVVEDSRLSVEREPQEGEIDG